MCKYTSWPCKWTVTVHICTVTVHRVIDFFILFFLSPLSTFDSPHSLFLISFLTSLSPINSLSKPINLSYQQFDQPLQSNTTVIPTDHDSDKPLSSPITWNRPTFSTDHDPAIQGLDSVNADDSNGFVLFDRWWWLVARCGWFWVCVGSVAQRRKQWLAGCGSMEKKSLWVCSRGKEIINM